MYATTTRVHSLLCVLIPGAALDELLDPSFAIREPSGQVLFPVQAM